MVRGDKVEEGVASQGTIVKLGIMSSGVVVMDVVMFVEVALLVVGEGVVEGHLD